MPFHEISLFHLFPSTSRFKDHLVVVCPICNVLTVPKKPKLDVVAVILDAGKVHTKQYIDKESGPKVRQELLTDLSKLGLHPLVAYLERLS